MLCSVRYTPNKVEYGRECTINGKIWRPTDGWNHTAMMTSSKGIYIPDQGFIANRGRIGFVYDYGNTASWGQMRPEVDGANKIGSPSHRFAYLHCPNGVTTTSDRRLKKDINYDLKKFYELFMEFDPVSYKYTDLDDDKTRFGFIAQDVRDKMIEYGLDPEKFAFLIKDEIAEDSDMAKRIGDTTVYSLKYDEGVAILFGLMKMMAEDIKVLKGEKNG